MHSFLLSLKLIAAEFYVLYDTQIIKSPKIFIKKYFFVFDHLCILLETFTIIEFYVHRYLCCRYFLII